MRSDCYLPRLLFLFVAAPFLPACHKTATCPAYDHHLGTLTWSAQTAAWLPEAYFHRPLTLIFRSESGETKTFALTELDTVVGPSHFIDIPCSNDPNDTTRLYFRLTRLVARMLSADSFAIDYSINIYNEHYGSDYREADFFENIGVSLNHFYDNQADGFGHVTIITDLRNAEPEDITLYQVDNNTHNDELIVHGQTLTDVYSDPKPEMLGANLFWKKGLGVVAYLDDHQVLWTLVQ